MRFYYGIVLSKTIIYEHFCLRRHFGCGPVETSAVRRAEEVVLFAVDGRGLSALLPGKSAERLQSLFGGSC